MLKSASLLTADIGINACCTGRYSEVSSHKSSFVPPPPTLHAARQQQREDTIERLITLIIVNRKLLKVH